MTATAIPATTIELRRAPLGAAAGAGLLPDEARLEAARALTVQFADAGVVPVHCERISPADAPLRVWLAHEHRQVTGSFKVRGALNAVAAHPGPIVAVSAGNHGAGVAHAARHLGRTATIVVPRDTPRAKRDKITAAGATIIVHDSPHYDVAEIAAKEIARDTGARFLSPYDDLDVLTGNGASLGFEITRALGRVPDAVLAPFGGGGLAVGLAAALAHDAHELLATHRRVWGAQSVASPAMAMSLADDRAVERLDGEATFADGLEGGIAARAYLRARASIAGVAVVDEAAIARAMVALEDDHGVRVEGSSAVAYAALTVFGASAFANGAASGDLVVVLTGRNVDDARFAEARRLAAGTPAASP